MTFPGMEMTILKFHDFSRFSMTVWTPSIVVLESVSQAILYFLYFNIFLVSVECGQSGRRKKQGSQMARRTASLWATTKMCVGFHGPETADGFTSTAGNQIKKRRTPPPVGELWWVSDSWWWIPWQLIQLVITHLPLSRQIICIFPAKLSAQSLIEAAPTAFTEPPETQLTLLRFTCRRGLRWGHQASPPPGFLALWLACSSLTVSTRGGSISNWCAQKLQGIFRNHRYQKPRWNDRLCNVLCVLVCVCVCVWESYQTVQVEVSQMGLWADTAAPSEHLLGSPNTAPWRWASAPPAHTHTHTHRYTMSTRWTTWRMFSQISRSTLPPPPGSKPPTPDLLRPRCRRDVWCLETHM